MGYTEGNADNFLQEDPMRNWILSNYGVNPDIAASVTHREIVNVLDPSSGYDVPDSDW